MLHLMLNFTILKNLTLINDASMKIIYDIGSNNGDDIEYYLKKADRVVAIEANPQLCAVIQQRFSKSIALGQLVVENYAVTDASGIKKVEFYIHRQNHVLSSLVKPVEADDYELYTVPAITIVDLIRKHGEPHYLKIDIEGYDAQVLRQLLDAEIRPPFISAESHTAEVFALLLALGNYKSFQLVEGATVADVYHNHPIKVRNSKERYSFPLHSAGPFGEDIKGSWMTPEDFHVFLASAGFGWKDIHASTEIKPRPTRLILPKNATFRMRLGRLRRELIGNLFKKAE